MFELEKLYELEKILLEHCYNMGILKIDSEKKKKDSILDNLIAAVIRSNISIEKLKQFIIDVNNNNVFDMTFFDNGGNVEDYINTKWIKFMRNLWRQRSIGLGTPNSASGEGELMFIFSSTHITKPIKGDLLINGNIKELKGEQARVNAKISGNNFRLKTLDVCYKYGLTPNKSSAKSKIECVEIEKNTHLEHWNKELNKLTINKQKEFISDWLRCISENFKKENIEKIFINDIFNHDIFIKEIIKLLFSESLKNNNIDSFILLGDGTNVKIINGNQNDFNNKIDKNIIKINSDYFRVNQDYDIGWYIE
jgi:hypothetical protein